MNILLIDNHDSFTYNIVEMLRRVTANSSFLHKINIIIRPVDKLNPGDLVAANKIILSPGPGVPEDYPQLFDLLRKYGSSKSILGVCMGHQVICRFFGGSLYNLPDVVHGQTANIQVKKSDSLLFGKAENMLVGLYHSWAVKADSLPEELECTAVSDEGVVMAVQHKIFDVHGVQFHPESYITESGCVIFRNFLNLK